jgi:SpoIIAA-like
MSLEIKMLQFKKEAAGKIVYVAVSGKLEKEDYEMLVPEMERAIEQHGKINLLFELLDFHGWSVGAAWEDTKFGVKHFNDIERLAIVGENKWEKGMVIFAKPFTTAKVRYFDIAERDEAERWMKEGL